MYEAIHLCKVMPSIVNYQSKMVKFTFKHMVIPSLTLRVKMPRSVTCSIKNILMHFCDATFDWITSKSCDSISCDILSEID